MSTSHRPTHITVAFVESGVSARARLRWDEAPGICRTIVDSLPFEVRAHHAVFSGSEIAAVTPDLPHLPAEGATTDISVGDLAYGSLRAKDHQGVDEDFTEICWFYGVDARPSMFAGPFAVSPFATFEDADEFFAVSRAMRLEGAKRIAVTSE